MSTQMPRTKSASPAEATLVRGVLEEIAIEEGQMPLIVGRDYDSEKLRTSISGQRLEPGTSPSPLKSVAEAAGWAEAPMLPPPLEDRTHHLLYQ